MAERLELAQVIGQLREELTVAMRDGEGADLRFELGPVEVELTVAVSTEVGPNAKVRFWVIELGADAKVSSQATQRIKFSSVLGHLNGSRYVGSGLASGMWVVEARKCPRCMLSPGTVWSARR